MIVKNNKTGIDVTGLYIKLLSGEITNEEFEDKAQIKKDGNIESADFVIGDFDEEEDKK